MRVLVQNILAILVVATLAGCDGATNDPGRDQPLQIAGATLRPGQLPAPPAEDPTGPLQVTAIELTSGHAGPGEQRSISGRTTSAAYAVALQLAGEGDGYWVQPVDGLDPQQAGERTWAATLAVGYGVAPGPKKLRVAAVGASGALGPSREVALCVTPNYPDNLNSCDPTRPPPDQIVQLAWDRDADLDLEIVRPDGSVLSAKKGGTAATGLLDVDAGANCGGDALRRENAVWSEAAPKGHYVARARLVNACGQPAVRLRVQVLRKVATTNGFTVNATLAWQGELLGSQADSAAPALAVAAWDVK